jgi:hypothetical protein
MPQYCRRNEEVSHWEMILRYKRNSWLFFEELADLHKLHFLQARIETRAHSVYVPLGSTLLLSVLSRLGRRLENVRELKEKKEPQADTTTWRLSFAQELSFKHGVTTTEHKAWLRKCKKMLQGIQSSVWLGSKNHCIEEQLILTKLMQFWTPWGLR